MKAALPFVSAIFAVVACSPAQSATINLRNCKPAFEDRFEQLDVSPYGPDTRWIAHTPWHGDFGDAQFTDPQPGFPFRTGPEGLTITARKGEDGRWRSGLLSSTDPKGDGFSAQYGYFEIETKLPPGKGTWPAFWLNTAGDVDPSVEIDIMEYYGHWTDRYQMVVTVRAPGQEAKSQLHWAHFAPGALLDSFHTVGAAVGRKHVVFYLDRREVWRTPTPKEHTKPLGILLNLALGSGWPIDETPNPSEMKVRRVSYFGELAGCGVNPAAAGD